jgi:aspartyl-tRNA(Asn)/glutamyl-tRNA(Gln) amidotransferase subunit B
MVKIGLEVHIYPKTKTKMFCRCKAGVEGEVNTSICPVCTGQPGAKPMAPNKKAIEQAIMLSLALRCRLKNSFTVLRKHYFYPDLPNNYQRTSTPIGTDGKLKGVAVSEVHVEEDAGRYELRKGLVDFNRAGTPLIEAVTAPVIGSPRHARDFLNGLKDLLLYLGIISKRGFFKVDTNISVGKNRVEVKNINSIKNVETVLKHEIERQKALLERGVEIKMETRHFDELRSITKTLREKETAEDYRYIPDPDLPVFGIGELIRKIKKSMPENLFELRKGYIRKYKIDGETARAITSSKVMVELFEYLKKEIEPRFVAVWMKKDLTGELKYRAKTLENSGLDIKDAKKLLKAYYKGEITKHKSRELLRGLLDRKISLDKGLKIKTEGKNIDKVIKKVLSENISAVGKYKKGKKTVFNFLLGEINRELGYEFPVRLLSKRLKKTLDG